MRACFLISPRLKLKEYPIKKLMFGRGLFLGTLKTFSKEISLDADQIKQSNFPNNQQIQRQSPAPGLFLVGSTGYFPVSQS